MAYYITGIVSIVITMIVQMSIAPLMQIASVIPNFLVIPLVFFSLGLRPKYKLGERHFENVFRGIFLGFFTGLVEGINSRLFWADVFSWVLIGFLLGLIAGPINRESPLVKSLLLFSSAFLQGIFFFIPLYISFSVSFSLFFGRLLFCSLYTTLLGVFILRLTEEKREEGIINYGD